MVGDETFEWQSQETSGAKSAEKKSSQQYMNINEKSKSSSGEKVCESSKQDSLPSNAINNSGASGSLTQKKRNFYSKFLTSPTELRDFKDPKFVIPSLYN